jgi:hypothetical protein
MLVDILFTVITIVLFALPFLIIHHKINKLKNDKISELRDFANQLEREHIRNIIDRYKG